MPITPAHAAAAWPLHAAARRLPLAALVIGTFAPDMEYVLRLPRGERFGHSPLGLVVFCLPVTLLLFWGWRARVRPALTPLLPAGLRAALEAPEPGGRMHVVLLAIAAALLGAVSHVVWDGFTHETGPIVDLLPVLVRPIGCCRLAWFTVAQYVSSLVGVLVVLLWIALAIRRVPAEGRAFAPGQRRRLVVAVLFVATVAVAVATANAWGASSPVVMARRVAVGAEMGVALGLVVYALYARSHRRTA